MCIVQRTALGAIHLVFGDKVSHWDLELSKETRPSVWPVTSSPPASASSELSFRLLPPSPALLHGSCGTNTDPCAFEASMLLAELSPALHELHLFVYGFFVVVLFLL